MAFSGQDVFTYEIIESVLPRIVYFESTLSLREALFAPPELLRQRAQMKQLAREQSDVLAQAISELGGNANWRPPQVDPTTEPRLYVSHNVAEVLKALATSRMSRFAARLRRLGEEDLDGIGGILNAGAILGRYILNMAGEPSYFVYKFTDSKNPEAVGQMERGDVLGFVRLQEEADRVIEDEQPLNVIISPGKRRMDVYERWPAGYVPVTSRAVVVDKMDLDQNYQA